METERIKAELICLISEMFKDKGFDVDVVEYVNLIDDAGMDSITFISLIVEIEARFNIIVPDELLLMEKFSNVDEIVAIIENVLMSKPNDEENEHDKT